MGVAHALNSMALQTIALNGMTLKTIAHRGGLLQHKNLEDRCASRLLSLRFS